MKNKNILVITNMYPSSQHKSFGIFVKNQVEALKEQQLQVDVVAITNPKSGKVSVLTKYLFWFLKTIFLLIFKGSKYDVVHAHYVFPSGYLGLLFKKLFKTRLIVTVHGGDIEKMAKKSPRLYRMTRTVLHGADHIIAVGEDLYEQIKKDYLIPPDKLSIINMGVNRQVFKPYNQQEARVQCGIGREEQVVLFVGNLIEQKGLLELTEAFEMAIKSRTDVQLYLIGSEKQPLFKKQLEEEINERQLESRVHFLGTREQTDIALWMSAADCLVLPAHMEGFGLVALEAMSCGTPVIGTNVGGLRHLLSGNAGIITSVKNPVELANAMVEVLSSKDTRDTLIRNGFKKAEENEQGQLLQKVINVYFPSGG
jgi:glycosyltransferase involved in cell wall biosynthesis